MRRALLLAVAALTCLGCRDEIKHRKEAVLREDLFTLRQSIDQFTHDETHPPESLQDLVAHGYMRVIPKDPFTESELTWQVIYDNSPPAAQDIPALAPNTIRQLRRIIDVHSGSDQIASDGTRYRDW